MGEVRPRGLKLTVIVPPYSDLRSGFTAPCGLPNQTAVINSLPPVPSLDPAKKRRQTRSRSQIWCKVPWGRGLPATKSRKEKKKYTCCRGKAVSLSVQQHAPRKSVTRHSSPSSFRSATHSRSPLMATRLTCAPYKMTHCLIVPLQFCAAEIESP